MKASSCTRFNVVGLVSLLAGCTVGPNYVAPRNHVANTFSEATPAAEPPAPISRVIPGVDAVQRWWLTFQDPVLDSLIKRAVAGNRDLIQAASRVRQARLARLEAGAGLFPDLNVGGGYNRGRGSKNVQIPLGGGGSSSSGSSSAKTLPRPNLSNEQPTRSKADSSSGGESGLASGGGTSTPSAGGSASAGGGGQPAGPQSPFGDGGLPGVTTELFQAGFDASWEIDIFGGTRRAIQFANAEVAVAEESRRSVLVSLLGEVASTYIQLRTTQLRLKIAGENLDAQRSILSITEAKVKAGFETELDAARQATQVALTASSIPAQQAMERTLIHSLAFLIGAESSSLNDEFGVSTALPAVPLEIPVGMPSDLLRRRSDIRRAERELAAATAQVGIATAELFPRFSLTGTAGLDSSKLVDLPRWSSRYYSIVPGVSWPILDWGRVRENIAVQNESENQAMTAYENTVALALRDVEDALVHFRTEQTRHTLLESAVNSAKNAFNIARQQFQHGLVDSTLVLDAQRSLLSSEDALAESDGAIRANLVSLYKALGGGWDT